MLVKSTAILCHGFNTGNSLQDAVVISHKYKVGIEFHDQDEVMGTSTIVLVGEEDNVRQALRQEWCENGESPEEVDVHVEALMGNWLANKVRNGELVKSDA